MKICRLFFCLLTLVLLSVSPAFAQQTFYGTGTLNKKINISVWYEVNNGIAVGEIRYKKGTTPICLVGIVQKNGSIEFHERLSDGVITGIIRGSLHGDTFIGQWISPDKIVKKGDNYIHKEGKHYELELKQSTASHHAYNWNASSAALSGKYIYSYGKNAAYGAIDIGKPDQDGLFTVNISTNIGAPSYNMAVVNITDATFYGKRLVHEEGPECAFELAVYPDFAVIAYLPGRTCPFCFGRGASVDGVYTRIQ